MKDAVYEGMDLVPEDFLELGDDPYSVPDELIGLIFPNDERVEVDADGPFIRVAGPKTTGLS